MLCLLIGIIRGHLFLGDFSIWFALDVWSGLSCLKNVAPAALPGGNKDAILQSHEYNGVSCWQCIVWIANIDFCCWGGCRVSIESYWVIMVQCWCFQDRAVAVPNIWRIVLQAYTLCMHRSCRNQLAALWVRQCWLLCECVKTAGFKVSSVKSVSFASGSARETASGSASW